MPSTPGDSGPCPGAAILAVIDTNVLLDFWVFGDPRALPLLAALERGDVGAVRSAPCVDELADVLARAELGVTEILRQEILARWNRLAMPMEEIEAAPLVCSDPDDQKFIDLAHSSRAGWLVTRDNALLELAQRARPSGLRIVPPLELARALGP